MSYIKKSNKMHGMGEHRDNMQNTRQYLSKQDNASLTSIPTTSQESKDQKDHDFRVSLNELRQEIDLINTDLVALLTRRGKVVQQIGELKRSEAQEVYYDALREKQQLEYIASINQGPFTDNALQDIFSGIFQASLDLVKQHGRLHPLFAKTDTHTHTTLEIDDVLIGGTHAPIVVAGPHGIESEEQLRQTAQFLHERGVRVLHGGAYQTVDTVDNDPYTVRGLGIDGVILGGKVARELDMLFMTEVMETADVEVMSEHVDILQVGAKNMSNIALLRELGRAQCPVVLQRGLAATVDEWLHAAEYILAAGNAEVILSESGVRTFEHATHQTLDISAVALVKQLSHLPVIVNVADAAGRRDLLIPLTKAALAVGADGVQLDVHPEPSATTHRYAQQLDFAEFEQLSEVIYPFLQVREISAQNATHNSSNGLQSKALQNKVQGYVQHIESLESEMVEQGRELAEPVI